MRLKHVNAIANINNQFIFQSGDGFLESLQITLGEQERASSCRFTFFDPGLKFLNLFWPNSSNRMVSTSQKNLLSEQKTVSSNESKPVASTNEDHTGYIKLLEDKYGASDLSGLTPLGRKCYQALSDPNVRAFLDAISIAELGETAAVNAGGYGYLYGDITLPFFLFFKEKELQRSTQLLLPIVYVFILYSMLFLFFCKYGFGDRRSPQVRLSRHLCVSHLFS